jgi:chaperone required for assembly of F1-ATPase
MPDKSIRDDLVPTADEALAQGIQPIDPLAMARRDLQKSWPKRFYKAAAAGVRDNDFSLLLDGRPAKTPAKNPLVVPTMAAAQDLAAEWERQQGVIDPGSMPLTRIVNSAIDGVARDMDATVEEIGKYGGTDLLCYRAAAPDGLAQAQAASWDPVLDFARERLGARLICAEGVIFVEQPEPARRALLKAIRRIANEGRGAPFALAALHVMTTLTGSALLALAVADEELTPAEAWAAAHVDEDFQMKLWGVDEEALRRRARRWAEMEAAAQLFRSVRPRPIH